VIVHFFDFTTALLVLTVVLAIAGIELSVYLFWLPVLLVLLVFLTAGFGMLLACANLFFRDVKYIVEVVLTFAIFFTPVFYDAHMFQEWTPLLLLNPVGSILEDINSIVIRQQPPGLFSLAYSTGWALLVFLGGWTVFNKATPAFAENV
jgi:ABC-type polysaccharide/polyol phosphate export permease